VETPEGVHKAAGAVSGKNHNGLLQKESIYFAVCLQQLYHASAQWGGDFYPLGCFIFETI
jgi:hypothetical protein